MAAVYGVFKNGTMQTYRQGKAEADKAAAVLRRRYPKAKITVKKL